VTLLSGEKRSCIVVLRLRGAAGLSRELRYVFNLMHLTKKYHATLMESNAERMGMVTKVKDYSTWGEVTPETISLLLRRRGRLKGRKKLTENYVKEVLGFTSIPALADALHTSKVNLWKLVEVKPLFRLTPPRKGLRGSIRRPYPEGELGYRGEAINRLIKRMV
jgi:large subunit ribosomal protein L30